jgi:hypothetical protein
MQRDNSAINSRRESVVRHSGSRSQQRPRPLEDGGRASVAAWDPSSIDDIILSVTLNVGWQQWDFGRSENDQMKQVFCSKTQSTALF